MKKETARDRILQVASELFYLEGIRAVGIDRIIKQSGVAKASFYRSFATKDDLVVAYLEARDELKVEKLERLRKLYPNSPKEQLDTLIRDVTEQMGTPEYRGCPFLNAAVEFPDRDHPAHIKLLDIQRSFWSRVLVLTREGGARQPEELTAQLRMLYEGFVMKSYLDRSNFDPQYFRRAAELLLEKQLAPVNQPE
ncbi:transcriptional regulator, TetR family [Paenibacillus sp. UNCCL117]|uniref:TetR/AcrR family transcriptional regulator n=1 Tax=unclassified Paenibacillus TaxID=185978 RepID=UPI00087E233A|nr:MULTISPECIES: TetR/AcrR family transcriptional regulator [unclassified Paenibacillus]SDD84024.1 DNA-binding transcriptional regulator, AcrR family [Paenibacillus sp. cl123]SFW54712.1 transcriptional regulator, TetR family [Paenibacillus sp. UNCCL117]